MKNIFAALLTIIVVLPATAQEAPRGALAPYETTLVQAARFFDGFAFSGDVRVRYEGMFDDTSTGTSDRNRGRYSVRVGFTKKINPRVLAGLRLATGVATAPSSAFQSFTTGANGKAISIDHAYIDVKPLSFWDGLHIIGGKVPHPFNTTNLVWDKDVSPEGLVERADWNWGSVKLDLTGAQFFLEDNAAPDDPYMLAGQLNLEHVLSEDAGLKWGATVAQFHTVRPFAVTAYAGSASNNPAGMFRTPSGFSVLDLTGFLEGRIGAATPVRLTGAWIRNLSAQTNLATNTVEDEGWLGELAIGKVTTAGTWEVAGGYRELEADATLAQFTDGDIGTVAGNTDVRGWFGRANYSPWKNFTVGIAGYGTERITGVDKLRRDKYQATVGVKF